MIRMPNHSDTPSTARRVAVVVALVTVVSSGYFVVAGLLDPGSLVAGGDAEAARVFAAYMSVRGVVVLGALAWCVAARRWRALSLVLVLNGLIQVLDAALGAVQQDVPRALGPALFAVALLAAAAWLTSAERGASTAERHSNTPGIPFPIAARSLRSRPE
jgi:hypothetical protein